MPYGSDYGKQSVVVTQLRGAYASVSIAALYFADNIYNEAS
jgi:hypothetical protein